MKYVTDADCFAPNIYILEIRMNVGETNRCAHVRKEEKN